MSSLSANLSGNSSGGPGGPPPWYMYHVCAVAPYGFLFYFAVKVINLGVGAPCNILVIKQIASKKTDASTDIFIFNLAVLDAYFCLMTPIEMSNRLLLGSANVWYFQKFAYGVKDFASLFLVCICLDRYVAVVHPLLFTGIRDNKIRMWVSALVWVLTLAHGLTKSLLGTVLVSGYFSAVILSAFALMLYCNVSVMWALRRSVVGKEAVHPVKKRAFRTLVTVLALIVVNYLPPVALLPFVQYYTFVDYRCKISTAVYSLMDLSSSLEPLLYIGKTDWTKVRCCCRRGAKNPNR